VVLALLAQTTAARGAAPAVGFVFQKRVGA
jgi:hypothetical protein